jgi:hypothetical protein
MIIAEGPCHMVLAIILNKHVERMIQYNMETPHSKL